MLNSGVIESIAVRRVQPLPYIYGRGGFSLGASDDQTKKNFAAIPADSEATHGISKSPDELALELERLAQERAASAPEKAYVAAGRQYARLQHDPTVFAAHPGADNQTLLSQNGQASGPQPLQSSRPESPEARTGSPVPQEQASTMGRNTGGTESRSPERTFLGGTAGATDRSPTGKPNEKADKADEAAPGTEHLTEEEAQEVEELKARDQEVRTHEQAHISAGAGLVSGGASYQTTRGPDGNTYAVGGEVQIDTSEEDNPDATIAKAQKIKSAALAPAEPSSQDRQVAAQAAQMEAAARQEKNTASEDKESAASSEREDEKAGSVDENDAVSQASRAWEADPAKSHRAGKAYRRAASLEFSFTPVITGLSINI